MHKWSIHAKNKKKQKTKNIKEEKKKCGGGLVATSWKEKEINFFFFYFWVEESYPLGAHMSRIDAWNISLLFNQWYFHNPI